MAKKAELLEKAQQMGLNVSNGNTIVQIEEAIRTAEEATAGETQAERHKHAVTEERHYAKSGKRSEKVEREVEAKIAKEERKLAGDTSPTDPDAEEVKKKGPTPITRSRLERRGKKYQAAAKKIDAAKRYTPAEAMQLATETSPTKFDATVEVHVRLGVDPRQADQNIRGTVVLPNGSGKSIRVAVFAPESEHAAAKKAGADIVGDEDFLKQLDKKELNFDVLIATPQYMPKLGKYARLLGPKGLMPNPKSGTVTTDVAKAVTEAKAGRAEYRVDKQSIVHLGIGKVSFGADKLDQNYQAFMTSLTSQKPSSIKGTFVQSITVTSTMGPAIHVAL